MLIIEGIKERCYVDCLKDLFKGNVIVTHDVIENGYDVEIVTNVVVTFCNDGVVIYNDYDKSDCVELRMSEDCLHIGRSEDR